MQTKIETREFYIKSELCIMQGFGGIISPSLRWDVDNLSEGTEEEVVQKTIRLIRGAFEMARTQAQLRQRD